MLYLAGKFHHMEPGWDPQVKLFFLRILRCISWGLIWLMTCVTAGIYFKLALPGERPVLYQFLFYFSFLISFLFLLRYFVRSWRGV